MRILSLLQRLLDLSQGIGYGSYSINKEVNSFYSFIPDGKIFVDVGGNKGLYSEALCNRFSPNQIHIFEPASTNIEILKAKFYKCDNIFINGCGLSNVNTDSVLYSDESGSGLGSLTKRNLEHFGIDFSLKENIKLQRFDDYWKINISSNFIDLFKIDVEGHELKVLEGIGSKISNIKVIQFEFGGCNIDTKTYFQDFWYFFKNHDFEMFRITPFGIFKIGKYKEEYERFQTTNYVCVNKRFINL